MRVTNLLLALSVTTGLAFAQEESDERRRGPRFDQLQEALNLSDAQLTALRENSSAMRQAVREAMEGTRESREAMRNEMQRDDPNEAVIAEHLAAMSETRGAVDAIQDEYRQNALALLDESQKAELANIEEALRVARLAPSAAALNLIEAPRAFHGPGVARRGFGRHGGPQGVRGPRGPRGGPGPR